MRLLVNCYLIYVPWIYFLWQNIFAVRSVFWNDIETTEHQAGVFVKILLLKQNKNVTVESKLEFPENELL